MPGHKTTDRADSYTDPASEMRLASAAETPGDANIPLSDNLESVKAINNVFLWLLPEAGVTATVQLWAVDGNDNWFFVEEVAIAIAGQAQVFHLANVPAAKYAAVVTALAGGALGVSVEHTA